MFENQTLPKQPIISKGCLIGLALALGICAVGILFVKITVKRAGEAEQNLQATIFAISLVEKFFDEHGRWPKSWDDLAGLKISGDPTTLDRKRTDVTRIGGRRSYDWPVELHEIRKRVFIDFEVDITTLAIQDVMDFSAIKPNGPSYNYRNYGLIESLQNSIRKVAEKNR